MTKENHGPYEFLGSMVVNLMNIDKSISYSFLEDELHISRRDVPCGRGRIYTFISTCVSSAVSWMRYIWKFC